MRNFYPQEKALQVQQYTPQFDNQSVGALSNESTPRSHKFYSNNSFYKSYETNNS